MRVQQRSRDEQTWDRQRSWLEEAQQVARDADRLRVARAGPDDLALLPYTSGTTGLPKGCMHTHATALHNVELPLVYAGVPSADRQKLATKALERVELADRCLADVAVCVGPERVVAGEMTGDFLAFIAGSPVLEHIGHFTEGVRAAGRDACQPTATASSLPMVPPTWSRVVYIAPTSSTSPVSSSFGNWMRSPGRKGRPRWR